MTLALASDAFLEGYRLARLEEDALDPELLIRQLLALGSERTPFAFEGAGMALEVRDARQPPRSRVRSVFDASSPEWHPFLKLGVGCGLARRSATPPEDPVMLDGYGFQLGLFGGLPIRSAHGHGSRFARGLGRATWFATGGDAAGSAAILARSEEVSERWRGIGTACAFAGDPKGHASALPELAIGYEEALRAGAGEALRLWQSFGAPPPRVGDVVAAFGGIPQRGRRPTRERPSL